MPDAMQDALNRIIKHHLPEVNDRIADAIRRDNLDPLANVAGGTAGGGLASASYAVRNLAGLSSLAIDDLAIVSARQGDGNRAPTIGAMTVAAHLDHIACDVSGSARLLTESIGISGQASLRQVTMKGIGHFQASMSNGKACLEAAGILSASVGYGAADVRVGELGPLNDLLEPLEQAVLGVLKGAIERLLSDNVRVVVNEQLDGLVPLCMDL